MKYGDCFSPPLNFPRLTVYTDSTARSVVKKYPLRACRTEVVSYRAGRRSIPSGARQAASDARHLVRSCSSAMNANSRYLRRQSHRAFVINLKVWILAVLNEVSLYLSAYLRMSSAKTNMFFTSTSAARNLRAPVPEQVPLLPLSFDFASYAGYQHHRS